MLEPIRPIVERIMDTIPNPYAQAIRDLDAMDAELDDGFETDFVVSNLARVAQYGDTTRFSEKQQKIIHALVKRYFGPEREAELAGQMRML